MPNMQNCGAHLPLLWRFIDSFGPFYTAEEIEAQKEAQKQTMSEEQTRHTPEEVQNDNNVQQTEASSEVIVPAQ